MSLPTQMSVLTTRWLFFRQYWKLTIHLVCKTAHFGVNNAWWVAHPSPLAWSCRQRVWAILTVMPLVRNYQSMMVRSTLGWIPEADCVALGLSHS